MHQPGAGRACAKAARQLLQNTAADVAARVPPPAPTATNVLLNTVSLPVRTLSCAPLCTPRGTLLLANVAELPTFMASRLSMGHFHHGRLLGNGLWGASVLSWLEPTKFHTLYTPSTVEKGQRSATIGLAGGALAFACTHMTGQPVQEAKGQLTAIFEDLNATAGALPRIKVAYSNSILLELFYSSTRVLPQDWMRRSKEDSNTSQWLHLKYDIKSYIFSRRVRNVMHHKVCSSISLRKLGSPGFIMAQACLSEFPTM